MGIPNDKQLFSFVRSRKFVNYTSIATHFEITKGTVSDIVREHVSKGTLKEKKIGSNKFVEVVE